MTASELDAALRAAIDADPRTVRQLAVDAGVQQSSLHRFYIDGGGLKWETACRLLAELGFELERKRV